MREVRCPDCGYRLKTNECPICFKRVPFPLPVKQTEKRIQQKRTVKVSFPKTVLRRHKKKTANPKQVFLSVAVVLLLTFLPVLGELVEQIPLPRQEQEDSVYEDYVAAGEEGTEQIPSLQKQTLYDDKGILITADSMGLLYGSPAMMLTVTNTSENEVNVSTSEVAVNGYMITSGLYRDVKPDETVQMLQWFDTGDLEAAGIDTVADIVMELDIYTAKDYEAVARGHRVHLQTSAAGYSQPVDDSGRAVYDDGRVRLVFRSAQVDEYADAQLRFFAENLTEDTVNIGADRILINGKEVDGMLWCSLWPDTRAIDHVYLYEVSEYGIEDSSDIKQITLELYVQNETDWQQVDRTVVINLES